MMNFYDEFYDFMKSTLFISSWSIKAINWGVGKYPSPSFLIPWAERSILIMLVCLSVCLFVSFSWLWWEWWWDKTLKAYLFKLWSNFDKWNNCDEVSGNRKHTLAAGGNALFGPTISWGIEPKSRFKVGARLLGGTVIF